MPDYVCPLEDRGTLLHMARLDIKANERVRNFSQRIRCSHWTVSLLGAHRHMLCVFLPVPETLCLGGVSSSHTTFVHCDKALGERLLAGRRRLCRALKHMSFVGLMAFQHS